MQIIKLPPEGLFIVCSMSNTTGHNNTPYQNPLTQMLAGCCVWLLRPSHPSNTQANYNIWNDVAYAPPCNEQLIVASPPFPRKLRPRTHYRNKKELSKVLFVWYYVVWSFCRTLVAWWCLSICNCNCTMKWITKGCMVHCCFWTAVRLCNKDLTRMSSALWLGWLGKYVVRSRVWILRE